MPGNSVLQVQSEVLRIARHVTRLGRQYPDLWKRVDQVRESANWPTWCFLPSAEFLKVLGCLQKTDSNLRTNWNAAAALASWRVTQGIYRFDPDLFECVWETPLDSEIPGEILFRLPEWCVYVMTPGCRFADRDLLGFFAHLDHDVDDGHSELRILLDVGAGRLISTLPVDLSGNHLQGGLEASRKRILEALRGGCRTVGYDEIGGHRFE